MKWLSLIVSLMALGYYAHRLQTTGKVWLYAPLVAVTLMCANSSFKDL